MKLFRKIKNRDYAARKGAGMLVGLMVAALGLLQPGQWNSGAGIAIFVWVMFTGVGTYVAQNVKENARFLNGKDDIDYSDPAEPVPRTEDGPWATDWEKRASREYLEEAFRRGRDLANWVEDKVGQ